MTDREREEGLSETAVLGIPGRQIHCCHVRDGNPSLRYLLFLPARYGQDAGDWPLMVFLHGAGERGNDLALVRTYGPPMIVESTPDFPFVVVSPQCPAGQQWKPERLVALIDDVVATHRIDRRRIVLSGVSLGGYGTWMTAAAYPGRFAALAPVCGWGTPALAQRIGKVPVWMFHGEQDDVVPVEESRKMLHAIRAAGGEARLTTFPGTGHDAWTEAYARPDLYAWLLEC